ncbi:dTDP-4-dehydrorhamnose 3,5-epimerase family protein [Geomicrobium sp. JCM 19039]|uniref:dTDP-4-dehydrorhamnose 3,5-epimerase family protein n=1 Tax=Geomicrobium sp. JCM 19039 TaxID=1460636 RepID=UPI00045F3496|nr:dTDP-4-dehydrorhamnose 3,5-epimerase family protein [Geomicrobium sp. JCM 19039]GAK11057.1 dTDP-4-dehydrorhamnose 3,5-epimerase [Geomicrobium sp. JCM 19039]
MIEGVKVKQLIKHHDDRGYFAELVREDESILTQFGQMSLSMSYPGVIKAFHYHEKQDDVWFFPAGNAQVVLYDTRRSSPTYKETDVYYMGESNPIVLLIPRFVAHGYRVLGNTPLSIIYLTTHAYRRDEPDEKRIAWNDPRIGFDWNTKHY